LSRLAPRRRHTFIRNRFTKSHSGMQSHATCEPSFVTHETAVSRYSPDQRHRHQRYRRW
jgi:hypothetical protein